MLIAHTRLTNTPVMSLHLGGRVATLAGPVIDPKNLRILAYELQTPATSNKKTYLMTPDIRELGSLGVIIDDTDDFVHYGDVIKLDELITLNFPLMGMLVRDEDGKRLGRVAGYTIETVRFEIQQLTVKSKGLRRLTDTGLLIHRSQIVEINDSAIIVKSTKQKLIQPTEATVRGNFVNPFRTPAQSPQVESSSATSP